MVQKRLLRGLAQEYIDLEHGCLEMASNPELRIFLLFPCKKIIFPVLSKLIQMKYAFKANLFFRPSVSLACHEGTVL